MKKTVQEIQYADLEKMRGILMQLDVARAQLLDTAYVNNAVYISNKLQEVIYLVETQLDEMVDPYE